ncbi:cysteate synthase [Methanohalobium sp.]|uniref:cysteate synthase n=1 Tax=Methanohalobium sp. TaxID=2837493 RepID=UPI0025CCFA8F|nr:cysteate synthase [Methanohalobium sp.]
MGNYNLKCLQCGRSYLGDYRLKCDDDDSFVQAEYQSKELDLKNAPGIGKYNEWLPVQDLLMTEAAPITYKSEELANELELSNLYISFSGYWPERNALIKTCSFKELEAHPTIQRLIESDHSSLVLASAGNTGRAFAHVSALNGVDVYIVVPPNGMSRMWIPEEPSDSIHLIKMDEGNDYTDAIHLADRIAKVPGIMPEGGARNIARRDGMGTVMLDAAVTIKQIPDHYFQAIGSGTGAIAAWEAALRLREDGRFGDHISKLHLSQNLPFAPMVNAWNACQRKIIPEIDMPEPKKSISDIFADVLSNRAPPYSVKGGVFDALEDTDGLMYGITNNEAKEAKALFESLEGIDILPPSAVAVASLIKSIDAENVDKDDVILLNIAGGGVERLKEDYTLSNIEPVASAKNPEIPLEDVLDK